MEVLQNTLATPDCYPGPLFTKPQDVLLPNPMKTWSLENICYNDGITLHFDRQLDSTVAQVPVKFQSDWESLNSNLVASRVHEILQ